MNLSRFPSLLSPKTRSSALCALACAVFSFGCAAELENDEEFVDNVTSGVGADGVENCDYLPCENPSVSPGTTEPMPSTDPSVDPSNPTTDPVAPDPVVPDPVGPDPVAPAPILSDECKDVPTRIFAAKCNSSVCHGSGTIYSDLVSDPDSLPSRLFNVASKECDGDPLIDPADFENSVLLKVLRDDFCTDYVMPVGIPLTDDEDRCVVEWVQAVAAGEL